MTVHSYLASRDVRHLAVHSGPTDTAPYGNRWVPLCGRASTDAEFAVSRPDDPRWASNSSRITRPVCKRCLGVLDELVLAAGHTPTPPPQPLPAIA